MEHIQANLYRHSHSNRAWKGVTWLSLVYGSTQVLWEKAMAPHSSTLAWKIPWTWEPGRLQSMGSWRVGHNWATSLSLFTFMLWRRKWQLTPLFFPGESQGWWSLVGCCLWGHRGGHNWSNLAAAAASLMGKYCLPLNLGVEHFSLLAWTLPPLRVSPHIIVLRLLMLLSRRVFLYHHVP